MYRTIKESHSPPAKLQLQTCQPKPLEDEAGD
jgi:hypothetical protein